MAKIANIHSNTIISL